MRSGSSRCRSPTTAWTASWRSYWRRPSAYLDERVRADIATFHLPGAERLLDGLDRLAEDLRTGRWEERNRDIMGREELDLGYRLLITELWRAAPLAKGKLGRDAPFEQWRVTVRRVACRDDQLRFGQWPAHAYAGIVPRDAHARRAGS